MHTRNPIFILGPHAVCWALKSWLIYKTPLIDMRITNIMRITCIAYLLELLLLQDQLNVQVIEGVTGFNLTFSPVQRRLSSPLYNQPIIFKLATIWPITRVNHQLLSSFFLTRFSLLFHSNSSLVYHHNADLREWDYS